MPTLNIGGKRVTVGDEFLKLSPEDQAAQVEEIAATLGVAAPETPPDPRGDVTVDNIVRSAARGIPVVGGLMDNLAAAGDAALAGAGIDRGSQAPTWQERYTANLKAEQERNRAFDEASPVTSTVAQVGGGVGALLPAAATKVGAKLLGLTGSTLRQKVAQGAASGAALNAADAVTRGEDPVLGAEVGGAFGALVPVAGAGIGAATRGVRRAMTPAPAPVPTAVARVADVDVPLTQSQVSGDAAQSAEEQILARGGRGEAAQQVAQDFRAQQQAALQQADEAISAGLDPTGRAVRTTPQQAAEAVRGELGTMAGAQEAAAARAAAAAAQEGEAIALAAGGGRTVADAPYTAGEILSRGLQASAQTARGARTAAYQAARDVDIEISPAALDRADVAIQNRLNEGERVRLNERTPRANEALQTIRETIQQGFEPVDAARGAALTRGPDGRPVPRNITGTDVDELRKDLIAMQRQANAAARGTNDNTDVRAMQRIIEAYEDVIEQAARAGTVRGDPDQFLAAMRAARESHRNLRQTFGARGPQDDAGKVIEKMLGRGGAEPASPDWIAQQAFGSVGEPGGQLQERVAQRLLDIFGAQSEQWAAYRQGLLAHLTETAPGTAARTPVQTAERIQKFINGTKGRGLAELVFNPAERQRLVAHAEQVRATAPAERPTDVVSRVVQRISGADGGLPATVNEITGYLFGTTGMGNKSVSVPLARRLKVDLTPESWNAVRQGMWSELTQVPEGKIAMKEQALSQRLHEFLNGDGKELAEVMFTERERNLMKQLADTYKKMIPVEGTTNPSGTAPMLAKIASKLQNVLLPLLGFSQGGMAGAAAGVAAQKGLERVVTRRAAKDATTRFYGPQPTPPKAPLNIPTLPSIVQRGATPALTNQ